MATLKQEMKTKESKVKETKGKQSIGFLRASERANTAVCDVPLNFLSDLGIMPEQMESLKVASHKFIGGMYEKLDSMAEAPGKVYDSIGAKFASLGAPKPKKAAQTPVVKPKPAAKKAAEAKKSSPKSAAKAAPKAKSKAPAKPKAAAKTKAAAKSKAAAKPKSAAKVEPKPKADPTRQPIGAMKAPRPGEGIH
jgi:hypothetical protein